MSFKASEIGGKILPTDVGVAKNYMTEKELKDMNRLVTMFLDYAERLAEQEVIMKMSDWSEKLKKFLEFNEYPISDGKGKISAKLAKSFALNEFSKFRVIQDINYKSDFNNFVKSLQNKMQPKK